MKIRGIVVGVVACATIGSGLGPVTAQSKPPPDHVPDLPGVGDPRGVAGPGPELAIHGGREHLARGRVAWIEVGCTTSTDAGCSGELVLENSRGRQIASAPFELAEGQASSVRFVVPPPLARRAGRPGGLRLTGAASATDSLGRAVSASAPITLIRDSR